METEKTPGDGLGQQMDESTSICFVCNRSFPLLNSSQDSKHIHNKEELIKVEECFAINFGLSPEEMARVSFFTKPDIYPFCSRCTTVAKELLKLQTRLTEVQEKLSRTTIELAAIIVNTYVYTLDDSPFFDLKNLIFEKWYDRIDQYCAEEEKLSAAIEEEIVTPKRSIEKKEHPEVSREVARLTRKGKGDKKPISIDEEEVEEVTCAVCNKVYRSKEYLNLHMLSHTGGTRPFSCPYCNKSFFGSSTLKKHIKTRHADVPVDEVFMEVEPPLHSGIETQFAKVTMENGETADLIIGRRIETPPPELEDQSLVTVEAQDDEFIYFEEEGNTPVTPDPVEKEKLKPTPQAPQGVECNYCGKRFATKVTLTKHIRTVHLKTIKVECPICKMTTRDHYNLSKHITSHNPKLTKLSYNCPLCGDGFPVRRELLGHYKRKHKLDVCQASVPQPIIRAIAEHDSLKMIIQNQKHSPASESKASANLIATLASQQPPHPQSPHSALERGQIPDMGKGAVDSGSFPEANNSGFPLLIKPKDGTIMSENKPVETKTATVSFARRKKRRRRALLGYSTRTKLLKQRLRFQAAKLSPIKQETRLSSCAGDEARINEGSMGVKLPERMDENLEGDAALVHAAQRCHPGLMKLNFNMSLRVEKFQTVLITPERQDEDDILFPKDVVNGVLQYIGNVVDPPVPTDPSRINVKIYGPKSKLAEIRSRKLKLYEAKSQASESEEPRSELKTAESPKLEMLKTKPGQLKTYGPKSKMVSNNLGSQHSAIFPNLTEQRNELEVTSLAQMETGTSVPSVVEKPGGNQLIPRKAKAMKPWIPVAQDDPDPTKTLQRGVGKYWHSNANTRNELLRNDTLPTPTASLSQDGRALILKTMLTKNTASSSQNLPATGRNERGPSSPPKLQPAPSNRVGYWEDASRILQSPRVAGGTSSFLLSPKKSPGKYPLPNKQLAQIAKSFRKVAPRHVGTTHVHPAKARVSEMARQLIKSGVTNPKVLPFGRTSSTTPGPIIDSAHSLAGLSSSFNLGAPQGKSAEVQALMRNSNINVSIVRPEGTTEVAEAKPPTPEMWNKLEIPRLPSGITLVQVEDVLKGNTPKNEGVVLSPSPKRRFIFQKAGNRGIKYMKYDGNVNVTPRPEAPDTTGEFPSPNSAPIRIRSMASLTDPAPEVEDAEPCEPEKPTQAMQSESPMTIVTEYGQKNVASFAMSQRKLHLPRTAAYRPFPQNETVRIMRYSEHIQVRQQQEQQRQQQPPPLQQFRKITVSPVINTTRSLIYFPVQPSSSTASVGAPSTLRNSDPDSNHSENNPNVS